MNKQILRGARLGNCVIQQDDVRIEIVCDFTDAIREEMEWSEPSQTQKLASFDDEFGGGSFKLAADQKALEGGTTSIAVPFDSMSGFRCVRCKEKGQESTRLELRFRVCSTAPEAVQLCQEYKRTVKKGCGQMRMKIGTAAQVEPADPAQPALPGASTKPERISNADGMRAGRRRKLEVVVNSENQPQGDADATAAAIAASLGDAGGNQTEALN